jgi:hypothetical protein
MLSWDGTGWAFMSVPAIVAQESQFHIIFSIFPHRYNKKIHECCVQLKKNHERRVHYAFVPGLLAWTRTVTSSLIPKPFLKLLIHL